VPRTRESGEIETVGKWRRGAGINIAPQKKFNGGAILTEIQGIFFSERNEYKTLSPIQI